MADCELSMLEQAHREVEIVLGELDAATRSPALFVAESFGRLRGEIETRAQSLLESLEIGSSERGWVGAFRLTMLDAVAEHESKCLAGAPSAGPLDAVGRHWSALAAVRDKYCAEVADEALIRCALEDYADLRELVEEDFVELCHELWQRRRLVFVGVRTESSRLGVLLSIESARLSVAEVHWIKGAFSEPRQQHQHLPQDIIEAVNEIEWQRSPVLFRTRLPRSLVLLSQMPPAGKLPREQAVVAVGNSRALYRTSLCLRGILLQLVPSEAFVQCTNLRTLNLSYNHIYRLASSAFHGLVSLVELDLGHNDIDAVETGLFADLHGLRELNLQNNLIERVAPGALAGLTHLRVLNLEQNRLKQVDAEMFSQLGELTNLYLGFNEIGRLETSAFRSVRSLVILHLSNNKLREIDLGLFVGLPALAILDLRHNYISRVRAPAEISTAAAEEDDEEQPFVEASAASATVNGGTSLKKLRLQNNEITKVDRAAFRAFAGLEFLSLSNNRIHELHADVFVGLEALERLDLSSNCLASLDERTLAPLVALTELYAEKNRLERLDERQFACNARLTRLCLRSNHLVELRAREPLLLDVLELDPQVKTHNVRERRRRSEGPLLAQLADWHSFGLFLLGALLFISIIILIILSIRKIFQSVVDLLRSSFK